MHKTFLDVNYYASAYTDPLDLIKAYDYNLSYLPEMPNSVEVYAIHRGKMETELKQNQVTHVFKQGAPIQKWQIPFSFHRSIQNINPDYILVHGMGYTLFAAILKLRLGSEKHVLVQSNGFSKPSKNILKRKLFSLASRYIDGFLFTGKTNAQHWTKAKVFSKDKVFEVMEGATPFQFDPSIEKEEQSFLWVGRLNENKDPLTILKAFNNHLKESPEAKLTMVYNEYDLLEEVKECIDQNLLLQSNVALLGPIKDRSKLERLFQKHQFFILGSHFEGSGYALVEAMACGCIPIITKIPSFDYMTKNGACALQFDPGDAITLFNLLQSTKDIAIDEYQTRVLQQVRDTLSAKAIAGDIRDIYSYLDGQKQS